MAIKNLGKVVGDSTYEIWLSQGNSGTEQDFLNSLKGKDGVNGTNGISPTITTSKIGKTTTLTITDVDGVKVTTINDGLDGYTPVKGVDYFDGQDGANGTTQLVPLFANNIEECVDTSKLYVLPDGFIYAYMTKEITQQAPELYDRSKSTLNQRYSGVYPNIVTKAGNGYYITDFIEVDMSLSDPIVVRFKNGTPFTINGTSDKLVLFDANKNPIETTYIYSQKIANGGNQSHLAEKDGDDYTLKLGYTYSATTANEAASVELSKCSVYNQIKYFRINQELSGSEITSTDNIPNVSITIDAMGGVIEETGWLSTGQAFVPADYEDRIIALEEENDTQDAELYELDNRVKSIEDGTSAINIPEYWEEAIEEVVTNVKEIQDEGGKDVINFMWFSDMHHNPNNVYTANIGSLCAKVMNECSIPFTLMCGDTMSADSVGTETILLNWLEDAQKVLSPIGADRLMQIRGNHDDVYGTSTTNGTTNYYVNKVSPSKIWNKLNREQAQDFSRVYGEDGTYFYIDNIPQKTRFIFLNTNFYDGEEINNGTTGAMTFGFGTEQLNWLENTALNPTTNVDNIVIALHVPPTESTINGRNDYLSLLSDGEDFRDALGKATKEIIGIFCGHAHVDAIVEDDLEIPILTITCAINTPYDGTGSQRVAGTTTETAIDVVSINKKTRTIYTTRLGWGEDRSITY